MFKKIRFRHLYMGLGSLIALAVYVATDPDLGLLNSLPVGASTVATLVVLLRSVYFIAMLHLSRRALFDYIDLERYFAKAISTAQGAGLALVSVSIAMLAIALTIFAATSN